MMILISRVMMTTVMCIVFMVCVLMVVVSVRDYACVVRRYMACVQTRHHTIVMVVGHNAKLDDHRQRGDQRHKVSYANADHQAVRISIRLGPRLCVNRFV